MHRLSRGSVLLLMPAALLIVLMLSAVTVDSAVVFLRQRQAHTIAFDAANDAVGAGIDLDLARADGRFVLDPVRVRVLAATSVAEAGLATARLVAAHVDGDAVTVTVEVPMDPVFGTVIRAQTVRATVRVDAQTR